MTIQDYKYILSCAIKPSMDRVVCLVALCLLGKYAIRRKYLSYYSTELQQKHKWHIYTYLASKDKDSVDMGEDAMKTEVNMRTDQRKNWGENTASRLKLGNKIRDAYVSYMTLYCVIYTINYWYILGIKNLVRCWNSDEYANYIVSKVLTSIRNQPKTE